MTYIESVTVDNATTTAQATGLTAGVLYYFKVVAYKGTHESTGTNIYDTRFKITVDTTKAGSANDTFILPNYTSGTYNYYVDWGEGGAEENITTTETHSHTYAASGTYQIKIRGTMPQIYFNNANDKAKLITIDNWGNIKWSSWISAFYGCVNLTTSSSDTPNSISVTTMQNMFRGCTLFNGYVNFNTSEVTSMDSVFRECPAFNKPLPWDTSKNINFHYFLQGANVFNQAVNFNTANVTAFDLMFQNNFVFNQSVSSFNTAKATTFSQMFASCYLFNQSVASFSTVLVNDMGEYAFRLQDI